MSRTAGSTIVMPFTIVIDTREQCPYSFSGIRADAKDHRLPIEVPLRFAALDTGDYSIEGYEMEVAIERKTLVDLYSTIGHGIGRFRREHERLANYGCKCVIIEASQEAALRNPPSHSRLNPKCISRIADAWFVDYGVPWFYFVDRRLAELKTFNLLRRFWQKQEKDKETAHHVH